MSTHENDPVTTHEHSADPNPKGEPETLSDTAPDPKALTVAEVSSYFQVSVSTIRRLLINGKLPGATKRKGPKGDEWVIPQADMVAQGYRFGGQFWRTAPQGEQAPTVGKVSATVGWGVGQMKQSYEQQLAEQQQRHDELLTALESQHQAEVARRESELQALQAEVDRQTERAEYERLLRESAETQAKMATAFAMQSQNRLLELETATAKRRWFRKQTKPKQSET